MQNFIFPNSVQSLATARAFIKNCKVRTPRYWFDDDCDAEYRLIELNSEQKAKLEQLMADNEGLDVSETIETYGDSELKHLILGMNDEDGTFEFLPGTYHSEPVYSYEFKVGLLVDDNQPLVFKTYSVVMSDEEYEQLLAARLDEGSCFHFQDLASKAPELYVKLSFHFTHVYDCAPMHHDHIVICSEAQEDAEKIKSVQDPDGAHDKATRHAFYDQILRQEIEMYLQHEIELEPFIKALRTDPFDDEYDDVHSQIATSAESEYSNGVISLEEAIEKMFQGLLVI